MEDLLKRAVGPAVLIAKRVPADLPPVRADANQLELALLNLAVNARDAMPHGGSVRITAREESRMPMATLPPTGLAGADYVRIGVSRHRDRHGPGDARQGDRTVLHHQGPRQGTGLGLSMVHGLAAQSGGALRVTSQVGQGTTVELWLPRAEASAGITKGPADVDAMVEGTSCFAPVAPLRCSSWMTTRW